MTYGRTGHFKSRPYRTTGSMGVVLKQTICHEIRSLEEAVLKTSFAW